MKGRGWKGLDKAKGGDGKGQIKEKGGDGKGQIKERKVMERAKQGEGRGW